MSSFDSSRQLRVYVTSCQTFPGAWRNQEELFRAAFPTADPRLQLCANPAASDLIFITDLRTENFYEALRNHELVRRFPERTFCISEVDDPPRYVQGVMTSLTKSPLNCGRFCSGAHFFNHPDFRNPYIDRYAADHTAFTKKYLFSFLGRDCIPLRTKLLAVRFTRPDVLVKDTSSFNVFSHDKSRSKDEDWRRFADVLRESKFVLCPRGNGASSIRLFEAMQLGLAPVILSDSWVLPEGPDWSQCAIRLAESRISEIESVLAAREVEAESIGQAARQAFRDHFEGASYIRYLVAAAERIQDARVFPERIMQKVEYLNLLAMRIRRRIRARR